MRVSLVLLALWVAAISRCDEPRSPPAPDPKPGDFVKIRGTLAEDVDCRTLRADSGVTYSLSTKLGRYANGATVCVYGTLAEATHCMTAPMIEVQSVKSPSACP